MSIALYRRYRPQTFAEVIGQEHVTEPLTQALSTGRVGHAYLFSGPRGCGKTTSARILARCLNCEEGPTATPCGECPSCVGLATGGAGTVDVIEIDAASHGGVDDARDLREKASYGPAQSRYKVYIIDEAHMVTPQGFNALLKIVEEPPEHVKFIFATTEPDKVIGTIRSRTHHYPFRLVPPSRLTDYLASLCEREGVAVEPGVLSFVVRAGGGSVRDSLSVLDQLIAGSGAEGLTYAGAAALLGFTEGELLDATVEALAVGDGGAVFRQVDRVVETGHDPRRFIEDLLERFRDLIIVAAFPDGAAAVLRGVPEDQLDRMRHQASSYGPGELSRCADIVNAGLTELTGATAPRLQLELICARLLLPAASGVGGYAARLDRLERRLDMAGPPSPATGGERGGPGGAASGGGKGARPAEGSGDRPERAGGFGAMDAVDATERPRAGGGPRPEDPPARGDQSASSASAPVPSGSPVSSGRVEAPGQAVHPPEGGDVTASGPGTDRGRAGEASGPGRGDATAAGTSDQAAQSPPRGGLDSDAIRRSWPDVLARIFTIRRVTWTFLSEHAQVLEYDGQRLVLGIATDGLTRTFHSGNHGEVVRQALIEALGVDVRIEGVSMTDGSAGGGPAGGASGGAARARRGSGGRAERGASRSGSGAAASRGRGAKRADGTDAATQPSAVEADRRAGDAGDEGADEKGETSRPDRPPMREAPGGDRPGGGSGREWRGGSPEGSGASPKGRGRSPEGSGASPKGRGGAPTSGAAGREHHGGGGAPRGGGSHVDGYPGDIPGPSDDDIPPDEDVPPPPDRGGWRGRGSTAAEGPRGSTSGGSRSAATGGPGADAGGTGRPEPRGSDARAPGRGASETGALRADATQTRARGTGAMEGQERPASADVGPASAEGARAHEGGPAGRSYGQFQGYSRLDDSGGSDTSGGGAVDRGATSDVEGPGAQWAPPEGPREELAGFAMPTPRPARSAGAGPYAEPEPAPAATDEIGESGGGAGRADGGAGEHNPEGRRQADERGGASRDDEDITDLTAVGQPVIEKILGGVVIADDAQGPDR